MKREVAKEGIFTQPNKTPLNSVETTDLHDILFYLNLQALERDENK